MFRSVGWVNRFLLRAAILAIWASDARNAAAQHWAFEAPVRPALPNLSADQQAAVRPIDRFVRARLAAEGMSPAPRADKRTLIRRVTLDLTGLPATPEEVAAFLADEQPHAYERVVDRLLDSPRYGERMASYWLDAARYSDSFGYHEDWARTMWPWRDWVIRAFNDNMPFDQFTVQQLAGDLLPNATPQQVLATGFNRLHGLTSSGIPEEYRVETMIDRVTTMATAWMGLTVGCAQCHDHKYDPITQQEFYELAAFFNQGSDPALMPNQPGNIEPLLKVESADVRHRVAEHEARIAELDRLLAERYDSIDDDLAAWESGQSGNADVRQPATAGLVVHCPLDATEGTFVANVASEGAPGTTHGTATWTSGRQIGALSLDGASGYVDLGSAIDFERTDAFSYGAWVRTDGDGSGAVVSRMDDGANYRGFDLYLTGGAVEVHIVHDWPDNTLHRRTTATLPPDAWHHLFVTYDGSSQAGGIRIYFNGEEQEAPITHDSLSATIRTETPVHIGRRNPSGFFRGQIDDLRIYDRELSPDEVAQLAGADPVGPILRIPAGERTAAERDQLKRYFLANHDSQSQAWTAEKQAATAGITQLRTSQPTLMIMDQMSEPRATFFLNRGVYDQPGHKVSPRTPGWLPAPPAEAPPNRLGLARWLVDPQHPLTSRVIVNQLWQIAFGTGLVKTTEDFGTQGALPSHPRLLDWLAVEFLASGWNVKALLRQIVTSDTYQQSSVVNSHDPENRLLARGSRHRLPAEMIRDSALFVSGLLVDKIGGPSVKPYQPAGIWKEMRNRAYVQDHGEDLYRRSVYTYRRRSVPPPNLYLFDSPDRETGCVRRQRTNTPLMALVTMNDPTFVEAARALAERSLKENANVEPAARIGHAFQLAVGRRADAGETEIREELYREQLAVYQADSAAAEQLLSVGESQRDESLDAAEHAALTTVASLILNLDETMTKE